jgi:hypothetical protein
MKETSGYGVPMIALYKGDSNAGAQMQPRERLAMIAQTDFNALWREIGIDVESWSPDVREQAKGFPYPHVYGIQNYIMYEHQCKADEVSALLAETAQLERTVQSLESKRALDTLFAVASAMSSEGFGIIFRPGIAEC